MEADSPETCYMEFLHGGARERGRNPLFKSFQISPLPSIQKFEKSILLNRREQIKVFANSSHFARTAVLMYPNFKSAVLDLVPVFAEIIVAAVGIPVYSTDSNYRLVVEEKSNKWASDGARSRMKYLIKNGQLEIVTGGWVMPDEATTQLFGLLNQLIEGHQWLYQQIGILPETGWSIDPFGVGSTIPYLLTAAGINKGYLIQRIHFAWKRFLARIGGLDAVWRPDFTNNDQYDMPLRVQHSSTYSLTDSCGILPKLCSLYDFNRAKKAVNFSNIRRRAEVLFPSPTVAKEDSVYTEYTG
uniref:Glyco_hydro_38N domain-containing protein n=1 Tax=Rhodnius prolixus TaxID=13249 RepID=T1H996_RHOPR